MAPVHNPHSFSYPRALHKECLCSPAQTTEVHVRTSFSMILYFIHLSFGDGGLSLNLWLTVLIRLANKWVRICLSLSNHCAPQLYVGSGDPNSGPRACIIDALLTEPSPQPPYSSLIAKHISSSVGMSEERMVLQKIPGQQAGLQTAADPKVSSQGRTDSQVSYRTGLHCKLQFREWQREGAPEHHLQNFNEALSTKINRLGSSWIHPHTPGAGFSNIRCC